MTEDRDNILEKLKKTDLKGIEELAGEIRRDMIDAVSRNGGHLASSLGVVELTLALHKVFDTPKDKIIWDVGHQAYSHKMLTGRWNRMDSLRQLNGISGFPKITESPYDASSPGHSGTSLSIALGYAVARELKHDDYNVIAVIGDGSLTSGVAWEALNNIGESHTPLIVILNDNEMSISKNIGGLSKHLQRLRTSSFYNNLKSNLKKVGGEKGQHRLASIRDAIKYSILPRDIFEEIGFKYYGPIDGHDIESMIKMLSFAKKLERPVIIHVITKKGKGFKPAEDDPTKFHGIGNFDPDPDSAGNEPDAGKSWSDAFGEALLECAKTDSRVCAITAAMRDSTGLNKMAWLYPSRVFDVGIAEQHAAAFAEGLALSGMKPVAAIYSTFLQRAYDQVLTEICLQKLPVVFAVDRAGVTGNDGETHQGIYDIAYLYSMPGMTIMSPRDEITLNIMLKKALEMDTPAAIRYPRGKVVSRPFRSGDGTPQILKQGRSVMIISDANMLDESLKAAEIIDDIKGKGYAAVSDIGTLKPLDEKFLSGCLRSYKNVITVEDGVFRGGFGTAAAQFAEENHFEADILNIGWPDAFIEHGNIQQLRERYKMDAKGIAERIIAFSGETN